MDISGKSKQLLRKVRREFGKEYNANFACGFSQILSTILKEPRQDKEFVQAKRASCLICAEPIDGFGLEPPACLGNTR